MNLHLSQSLYIILTILTINYQCLNSYIITHTPPPPQSFHSPIHERIVHQPFQTTRRTPLTNTKLHITGGGKQGKIKFRTNEIFLTRPFSSVHGSQDAKLLTPPLKPKLKLQAGLKSKAVKSLVKPRVNPTRVLSKTGGDVIDFTLPPPIVLQNAIILLSQLGAYDIKVVNVMNCTSIMDYVCIVTGSSDRIIGSMVDKVQEVVEGRKSGAKVKSPREIKEDSERMKSYNSNDGAMTSTYDKIQQITNQKFESLHRITPQGKATGWVVLDYGFIVFHFFTDDERARINLGGVLGGGFDVDFIALLGDLDGFRSHGGDGGDDYGDDCGDGFDSVDSIGFKNRDYDRNAVFNVRDVDNIPTLNGYNYGANDDERERERERDDRDIGKERDVNDDVDKDDPFWTPL